MKMNFLKARKISQVMNYISILGLILFIALRLSNPTVAWVAFGVVMVLGVAVFPLNWKYLRCPSCTHVIPSYQFRSMTCPICSAKLGIDENGNLKVLPKDGETGSPFGGP